MQRFGIANAFVGACRGVAYHSSQTRSAQYNPAQHWSHSQPPPTRDSQAVATVSSIAPVIAAIPMELSSPRHMILVVVYYKSQQATISLIPRAQRLAAVLELHVAPQPNDSLLDGATVDWWELRRRVASLQTAPLSWLSADLVVLHAHTCLNALSLTHQRCQMGDLGRWVPAVRAGEEAGPERAERSSTVTTRLQHIRASYCRIEGNHPQVQSESPIRPKVQCTGNSVCRTSDCGV